MNQRQRERRSIVATALVVAAALAAGQAIAADIPVKAPC